MKTLLIFKNIVLIGGFKPSNFDKLYFIKNELFKETEFQENCVFTSELVIIETRNVTINIAKNQTIITLKDVNLDYPIEKIASSIVSKNNESITAIGFNFKWFYFIENDYYKVSKSLFYAPGNVIINTHFKDENVAYGYYVSKDFLQSRLKLDVKPLNLINSEEAESKNVLSFDFNFHFDYDLQNRETLFKIINEYYMYLNESKNIMNDYAKK